MRLVFSTHARKRAEERDVEEEEILHVLQHPEQDMPGGLSSEGLETRWAVGGRLVVVYRDIIGVDPPAVKIITVHIRRGAELL